MRSGLILGDGFVFWILILVSHSLFKFGSAASEIPHQRWNSRAAKKQRRDNQEDQKFCSAKAEHWWVPISGGRWVVRAKNFVTVRPFYWPRPTCQMMKSALFS